MPRLGPDVVIDNTAMSKFNLSNSVLHGSVIGTGNRVTWDGQDERSSGHPVVVIRGARITGSTAGHQTRECTHLEVVAKDSDGRVLDSYVLPAAGFKLDVAASLIGDIITQTGDVTVNADKVEKVHVVNGSVVVSKAKEIGKLWTMNGDVTVQRCKIVGDARSTNGRVDIQESEPTPSGTWRLKKHRRRDGSPLRK